MAIILLSFSYCNFEVSTLSTYHVGDPKNLLPIRHGSWGILTTRGFLIEREAGSTSPNLAVPRFYRCMCMCALLSLVLRSMIGIFIGILNGLILEASSISSRPKLLISLTWQVSISDKNDDAGCSLLCNSYTQRHIDSNSLMCCRHLPQKPMRFVH